MFKLVIVVVLLLALCGCSGAQVLETVTDSELTPIIAQARELELTLPEDAAVYTAAVGSDRVYFCDGYCITVQTLAGGNINSTMQQVTGFSRDALSVMETRQDDALRYDLAWSCMAEEGQQVCRATVLDDGYYHYAVAVMGDYEDAGRMLDSWEQVLGSVALSRID